MPFNYRDTTWEAGAYLKCEDDHFSDAQRERTPNLPVKGLYYRIRKVQCIMLPTREQRYYVLLEEIINPAVAIYDNGKRVLSEPSFKIERFSFTSNGFDVDQFMQSVYETLLNSKFPNCG